MLRVPPSLGHAPPVKPPRRYVVEDGAPSLFEEDKANRGSVWHHLKTSYRHLVQVVGLGPNGLLRMRHADWNDEVLQHVPPSQRIGIATHGESVLVSAMAVYVTGAHLVWFALHVRDTWTHSLPHAAVTVATQARAAEIRRPGCIARRGEARQLRPRTGE